MQVLSTDYDFYALAEEDRKAMVGDFFVEKEPLARLGIEKVCRFYPIQLTIQGSYFNYNRRQGVLHLSALWPYYDYKKTGKAIRTGKLWFKVGCFSPDDLDLSLEWIDPPGGLREKVMELLAKMPKDEVEYEECLRFIQSFLGGTIVPN